MADWEVLSIEPVTMHRINRLANMYVLSPFVWRQGGKFRLLVRGVPRRDDDKTLKMSEIWHGVSADGHHFDMDIAPAIFPGPDIIDVDGCEDPTVRVDRGMVRVWYTGTNEQQKTGRLLLARGPDVDRLGKTGLALDSSPAFTNPKEATVVALAPRRWRLYFECSSDDASAIAQADSDSVDGPWTDLAMSPLSTRAGQWDSYHLSPGPIVGERTDQPTMFYNGASEDAQWRIGWATFDRELGKIVRRCGPPLIAPDDERLKGESDMAFVASAVEYRGRVLLYFTQSDQNLCRAVLQRR